MIIYFKCLFGDMNGESVIFFNIIASKTTWTVTFRATYFPFQGYNLDITKWLLKLRTERKETNERSVKTDLTSGSACDTFCNQNWISVYFLLPALYFKGPSRTIDKPQFRFWQDLIDVHCTKIFNSWILMKKYLVLRESSAIYFAVDISPFQFFANTSGTKEKSKTFAHVFEVSLPHANNASKSEVHTNF